MELNATYDYLDVLDDMEYDELRGRLLCEGVQAEWIGGNYDVAQNMCSPHWDRISCWPATERGNLATIPCMDQLNGIQYDTSYNATLDCLASGVWANKSDYSHCKQLVLAETGLSSKGLSLIYFCGYSLSLSALVIAFSICLYFKEMRCLRNKIHANLFLTYMLANSCWILTALMQDAHFNHHSVELSWCVSLVFVRYFHLATFFWMFVEGMYLFVQVIATFSVENSNIKLRHYVIIGWGIPFFVVLLWATLTYRRSYYFNRQPSELGVAMCPFIEKSSTEWAYIVPVFLLLATNTFFLVSIFYVVVTKLRSTGPGEADHQNWKAAKALLVIIPLLGITYLITILGPNDTHTMSFVIFEHVRAVLLSTQGFTVTLPYCFLNTEVKGIVKHHWTRWRAARSVENHYSRGQSARNSISLAGYYACDSNTTNVSSRRNSFLRLHAQYLWGSTPHQPSDNHLVTSVILEKGASNSRVIPVIQEESDFQTTTLISITPPTPLPSPGEQDKVPHAPHQINSSQD